MAADGPHTDPDIDAEEFAGLAIKDGIASFNIHGKQLIEQKRKRVLLALGAPLAESEYVPVEAPDTGGSAPSGITTGRLTGGTATGTADAPPIIEEEIDLTGDDPAPPLEAGDDLDAAMNDDVEFHTASLISPLIRIVKHVKLPKDGTCVAGLAHSRLGSMSNLGNSVTYGQWMIYRWLKDLVLQPWGVISI